MKKDIGAVRALYPTPSVVVGTIVDGKVNWNQIAHIGIVGTEYILLSCNKAHYSNKGIKENKVVSVSLVNEAMLTKADYVGIASGAKADKSGVFEYHMGALNVPIIEESPVVMECELVDTYDSKDYDNFILKVVHTHAEEDVLTEKGKIDYEKVKPVLFEMPTFSYIKTGEKIGTAASLGGQYKA